MPQTMRPTYRQAVRDIQTFLYILSQTDSRVPRVNPDGIYGPETATAVTAFQEAYLGFGDGRVDFATWQALVAHSRRAKEALGEPQRIAPFTAPLKEGRLIRGDRSDLVRMASLMLATLSLDHREAEEVTESDLFDDAMEEAVRAFQLVWGLDPTGEIDRLTWDRLALSYNKTVRLD